MKKIIKLSFFIYILFYTISGFAHEINNCSCESDCYTEEIKDLYYKWVLKFEDNPEGPMFFALY